MRWAVALTVAILTVIVVARPDPTWAGQGNDLLAADKAAADKPAGDKDKPTADKTATDKADFPKTDATKTDTRPTTEVKPADTKSAATPATAPVVAASPTDAKPEKPVLTEVKPDLLYVRDEKTGTLVPVPNVTLKEITEQAEKRAATDKASAKPLYGIQQMKISGTASGERADLNVDFQIQLTSLDWVRVPLHFSKAALRESPKVVGKGESLMQFDRGGDGYVVWLRGSEKPESTRVPKEISPIELNLSLLATLPRGERVLELDVPNAVISDIQLIVPVKVLSATATGSSPVSPPKMSNGKTELSAFDLKAGDFKLTWTEADAGTSNSTPLLDANIAVYARCELHSIKYEANMTVRTLRGPFDRFRVELPQGSTFSPDKSSADKAAGYSVSVVESKDTPTVEVLLDKPLKEKESIAVKLAAERSYDPKTARNTGFSLGSFSLLPDPAAKPGEQTVKQYGVLGLAVSDEMTLRWDKPGNALRQVDRFPDDKRRADLVAAFEYTGKPDIKVLPTMRNSKIIVEPEYVYIVEKDKVRLEAVWTYQIGRAKLNDLEFELPDAMWEIDDIGPANVLSLDDAAPENNTYRVRPLQKQSAGADEENVLPTLTGKVELTIKAHAPLNAKTDALTWPLAAPKESTGNAASQLTIAPATVVVLLADNISLMPQLDGSNLQPQTGAPPTTLAAKLAELGSRQQKPLIYRVDTGSLAMTNFSAKWMVRKQAIAVEATNDVRLWPEGRKRIEVHQALKYQVDNVPAEQLTLEIPRRLDDLHVPLKFSLNGVEVQPEKSADVRADEEAAMGRRVQVKLPEGGKIGSFSLTVDYAQTIDEPHIDTVHPFAVPLVLPVDSDLKSNETQLTAGAGIRVTSVEEPWLEIARPEVSASADVTHYRAEAAVADIQLQAMSENLQAQGKSQISRAWLQTWLGEFTRQDRAAYRFTSNQDHLEFKMPSGLKSSDLRVQLDGKPIHVSFSSGRLSVPLKSLQGSTGEHTLELTYRFDGRMLARSQLSLETPVPQGTVWIDRTYWQLVLPHDKHLIVNPEELTPQYAWQWQGAYYGRQPLMEQADLESWVGVAREHALPDSTNRYLFSALATDGDFQLTVASRALVVGIASLIALALGLLLIYVGPLRRPTLLVVMAIALAGIAMVYAELAVLLAQGATLGLGLTLLAAFLYRGLRRRQARLVAVRQSPPSAVERVSTELHAQPMGLPPRRGDSAATATMTLEIPASESHV